MRSAGSFVVCDIFLWVRCLQAKHESGGKQNVLVMRKQWKCRHIPAHVLPLNTLYAPLKGLQNKVIRLVYNSLCSPNQSIGFIQSPYTRYHALVCVCVLCITAHMLHLFAMWTVCTLEQN